MATPSATGGPAAPAPPAGPAAGASARQADGRGRHPANPYLLYFQEMRKTRGGNIYKLAKECGQGWRVLSWNQKNKYRQLYLQNRAAFGTKKTTGGYTKPSQADKWNAWPKVPKRNAYVSKKKKLEMARKKAQEEALRKKKNADVQCDLQQ